MSDFQSLFYFWISELMIQRFKLGYLADKLWDPTRLWYSANTSLFYDITNDDVGDCH